MALPTVTITGACPLPDGIAPGSATIEFLLSGFDTDGVEVVVPIVRQFQLVEGNLPASASVWPNTEGLRGTFYAVRVLVYDSQLNRTTAYPLGNVQIAATPITQTLSSLLNNPVPAAPSWNVNLNPAEYGAIIAEMEALADRAEAAAALADSEGNATISLEAAENAQAWAESPTAPGAPGTKSSKTWATDAEDAAVRAEDFLNYAVQGGYIYDSRADAEAANVPTPVTRISVTSGGRALHYIEDDDGTALTTNGGLRSWSPNGQITPNHWAENTIQGTTDMGPAILAAWEHGQNVDLLAQVYAHDGDLLLRGSQAAGTPFFDKARFVGAGPSLTQLVNLDNTTDGLLFDNAVDGGANKFLTGEIGGFSLNVNAQTKANVKRGLTLRRVWGATVRDIIIDGYTDHVRCEGAVLNKFSNVHTRNGKRSQLSESVWTFTNGLYSNSYGNSLVECKHQAGTDAERMFDIQACDGLTITGGFFNNARVDFHIRPDGTTHQRYIAQIKAQGAYFDGDAGVNNESIYIETLGGASNIRIEGLDFDCTMHRVGTSCLKLSENATTATGLQTLKDIKFTGCEIQDFSGRIFDVYNPNIANPKSIISNLTWNGNQIMDEGILGGRTNAPNCWRLEGKNININGNTVVGGWTDGGGAALLNLTARAEQGNVTSNIFDVAQVSPIINSGVNINVAGNKWPALGDLYRINNTVSIGNVLGAGLILEPRDHLTDTDLVTKDNAVIGVETSLSIAMKAGGFARWLKDSTSASTGIDGGTEIMRLDDQKLHVQVPLVGGDFGTRPEFVSWNTTNAALTIADGTIVFSGGLSYIRKAGSTAIADIAGWIPNPAYGVTPDHFGHNATPGTTDMSSAVQAALYYVCGGSGVDFAIGRAPKAVLDFMPVDYYFGSTVKWEGTEDELWLRGNGARVHTNLGIALFQCGPDALFNNGDTTGLVVSYDCKISDFVFSNTDGTSTSSVAIRAGQNVGMVITHCTFHDFWVAIDGHRYKGRSITDNHFYLSSNRTVQAKASIRFQGVYSSTESATPGGGVHINGNEFWGNPTDAGKIEAHILVHAIDGLYFASNHFRQYDIGIKLAPEGSTNNSKNNIITDVISNGGNYFDNPNTGTKSVSIEGTVTYAGTSGQANGSYKNISFGNKDYFRGAGIAQNAILFDVTDGGGFEAARGGIHGLHISGVRFDGFSNTPILFRGASVSRIEAVGVSINNNQFRDNNHGSNAVSGISGEVKSALISDNMFGPEANAPSRCVSINATVSAVGHSVTIADNDFSQSDYSDALPYFVSSSAGLAYAASGNTLRANPGTFIEQSFSAETVNYSGVLPFTFDVLGTDRAMQVLLNVTGYATAGSATQDAHTSYDIYAMFSRDGAGAMTRRVNAKNRALRSFTNNTNPVDVVLMTGPLFVASTTIVALGDVIVNSAGRAYMVITGSGTVGATEPTVVGGAWFNSGIRYLDLGLEDTNRLAVVVSAENSITMSWAGQIKIIGSH